MGLCCAYETAKLVAIRDARLAFLRYALVVCIIAYVVVFEMLGSGGYLSSSPTVGVVRFSLQHPTKGNCDPGDSGCTNDFDPADRLPYCRQHENITGESSYRGNVYPCEIYESINSQIISEKSIVVITRASTKKQSLVCSAEDFTCPRTYGDVSDEYKFYTAQSERFTVLFDHAVTASQICSRRSSKEHYRSGDVNDYACSAESSRYSGRLHSKNSDLCEDANFRGKAFLHYRGFQPTDTSPCFIEPNHTDTKQDFFTLETILKAAGVNMDDCNAGINAGLNGADGATCKTFRETGAALLLNIYWSDFAAYRGLIEPSYYYSPQLIAGSSFKQYVPFYTSYRTQRTLLNAHGIKIAVLLGGEFHTFDMLSFLITLTTAVGLLAVATTLVDLLMLYVLPERERYQNAKYESTEEFEGRNIVSSAFNHLLSPGGGDERGETDAAENASEQDLLRRALLSEEDSSLSNSST